MRDSLIRVRFAPSPTGPLHIGGVRTALYNYLFAKKNNGDFILRIEDTDQSRFVKGAEEYIIEALKWCGIEFNEGVGIGGPHAPYRQSERKDIYKKYVTELVEKGFAYYAFDTPEELETLRKIQETNKDSLAGYNYISRLSMKNSFTLSAYECENKINSGHPYVIRFKIPENEKIIFNDIIRGQIEIHTSVLDDKVLYKSDGMPTYHLANVVDDYLMQISHVIRGEEWLPSTPLHILLYKAFGWENYMPQFAHLPLLLKPNGKGKLSKRDGDQMGFPVFPIQWKNPDGEIFSGYRESGYLPEAFINIIALLGWNPASDKEIYSIDELIQNFSLQQINKSGARFNPDKAKWFNHQYIQQKPDEFLCTELKNQLSTNNIKANDELLKKIIVLIKERITLLTDLFEQAKLFFIDPETYNTDYVKKRWTAQSPDIIKTFIETIDIIEPFNTHNIEVALKQTIEKNHYHMGSVMNLIRLCLVGEQKGPGLAEIMEIIGKETTIKRLQNAISRIKSHE
jgi:glutamyl-tRNA synthetase